MKKIEFIWREVLTAALEDHRVDFEQKELASQFNLSTGTAFHSLKKPRGIGAIEVSGRGFRLVDFEKLLFYWATQRNLKNDLVYETHASLPVMEIEGLMPPKVTPTAYTAYRFIFGDPPADYDQVYFYTRDLAFVKDRFPPQKKKPANIFILKPDPWLDNYQPKPPLVQTFVDLWNLSEWYAKDFQNALLEKMREKLGL